MIVKSLDNESDLLRKIAKRDELAFATVYNFYSRKIYRFSLEILDSKSQAEEVMQELMLKIWLMGDELNKINDLNSYLKKASSNRSLNILKRQSVERRVNRELGWKWKESTNETEEQILLNVIRRALREGIAQLPDHQRQVYKLCHQEGLRYEEAAAHTGLSIETVKSYMKNALRFLRNYVSRHSDKALVIIFVHFLKLF